MSSKGKCDKHEFGKIDCPDCIRAFKEFCKENGCHVITDEPKLKGGRT